MRDDGVPHQAPGVRDVLRGKTILLTGSTGFLAKVFLEKTLRLSPDVGRIYLLVRAVDRDHSRERLEQDVFSSPLFARLKAADPAGFVELVREKVRFVAGDTSAPRLGLEPRTHLQLLNDVDLVVNAAASTEFMEPLDVAVATNALSVARIADFAAAGGKRLLHVSTCYVNESGRGIADEKLGGFPAGARLPKRPDGRIDVEAVLAELERTVRAVRGDGSASAKETSQRLVDAGLLFARRHGWHNIYTFTKWLGEQILLESSGNFPCRIVRPSIVESCLFEPEAGWIEGLKVADPLIYAVGMNRIQFFPGRESSALDLIPVDLVSNAMFLAIGELGSGDAGPPKVYQSCSSFENPLTLKHLTRIVRRNFDTKYLFHRALYPAPVFGALVAVLVLAAAAARAVGVVTRLKGFARFSGAVTRDLAKLQQVSAIYAPYTASRKVYANAELLKLYARAHDADRLLFPVSARRIDWDRYIGGIHIPGLLRFVIHAGRPAAASVRAPDESRKAA